MVKLSPEEIILRRCMDVLYDMSDIAYNPKEANVFWLAAMVIRSNYPCESARLLQVSEDYFLYYPDQQLPVANVIQNGWIVNLHRLRDLLSFKIIKYKNSNNLLEDSA